MSIEHVAELKTGIEVAQLCTHTIPTLFIDAGEQAKSVNPGTPQPEFSTVLTFGASAPLKALPKKFGFEPDRVDLTAKELLRRGE